MKLNVDSIVVVDLLVEYLEKIEFPFIVYFMSMLFSNSVSLFLQYSYEIAIFLWDYVTGTNYISLFFLSLWWNWEYYVRLLTDLIYIWSIVGWYGISFLSTSKELTYKTSIICGENWMWDEEVLHSKMIILKFLIYLLVSWLYNIWYDSFRL